MAGGSNWAGGARHKPDGSPDVPDNVWAAVDEIRLTPLSDPTSGNGVVRITIIRR